MSKKAYIGVPTECLTYTNINENNVAEFFTITGSNTAETGFGWNDDIFITAGGNISNITRAMKHLEITTTLSAIVNINNLTLNWNSLTDSSLNDIFRIKIIHIDNTETIYVESNGEESGILTFSLLAGEKIELYVFRNVKSSMTDRYSAIFNLRIPNGTEVKEVARNVSDIYIGVPTEVPIYDENSGNVSLTSENIETYFNVTHDGYGNMFQWIDDMLVSDWTNPVKPSAYNDIQTYVAVHESSVINLTAVNKINFSFYVHFTDSMARIIDPDTSPPVAILINSDTYCIVTTDEYITVQLNVGDILTIVHSRSAPYVYLSDLEILGDKEIIGTYIESRAHKVIKAYVGVNGVAKQWYGNIICEIPFTNNFIDYTGNSITPVWNNYDSSKMDMSGDVSAIEIGVYTTIFTLKQGNVWVDGTTEPKHITWKIALSLRDLLIDFNYTEDNGIATITGWKGTYQGIASAEIIVPNDSRIIL